MIDIGLQHLSPTAYFRSGKGLDAYKHICIRSGGEVSPSRGIRPFSGIAGCQNRVLHPGLEWL